MVDKKALSPEQIYVTQEKGTERPFSGKYYDYVESGEYVCVCCDNRLFDSNTKFDSGTGWPSFWQEIEDGRVKNIPDNGLGMQRTETVCTNCGAHLGHVFEDGPEPTGLRYCINSASLNFIKKPPG